MGTIDSKSPLTEHLQLAPWPLHYGAVPPPKYHGNTDPLKFLMCYEAAIASAGGNKSTLKSLIISLEDAAANWYSGLLLCCIYSWQYLKDKIFLNFQGFQAELDTEEDSLMHSKGERIITEFLLEVLLAQSPGIRGVQRASHRTSYKSFKGRPFAQPLGLKMAQNSARATRSIYKI
jgi:hypothetical protein